MNKIKQSFKQIAEKLLEATNVSTKPTNTMADIIEACGQIYNLLEQHQVELSREYVSEKEDGEDGIANFLKEVNFFIKKWQDDIVKQSGKAIKILNNDAYPSRLKAEENEREALYFEVEESDPKLPFPCEAPEETKALPVPDEVDDSEITNE